MIKNKTLLIIGLSLVIMGAGVLTYDYYSDGKAKEYSQNDIFRNSAVKYVREIADSYLAGRKEKEPEELLKIGGDWQAEIKLYYKGDIKGEGKSAQKELTFVLKQAAEFLIGTVVLQDLDKEAIKQGRFLITLSRGSDKPFSFVEYGNEGREVLDGLVLMRSLDKDLIKEKVGQAKDFLLRMEHPEEHGFYKRYEAPVDYLENRLHTVYSASIIYTLLYYYDFTKDREILDKIPAWADFLLSMQNKESGKAYGAFYYSYFLEDKSREKKFVSGTSALNVFTLLRLYDLFGDEKYLESAKLAGDWLITIQMENGVMKPYLRYDENENKWLSGNQESLLYNGQVLSALSKLYKATGDKKYYDTAEKIANHFAGKYEAVRDYVVDEYRTVNSISNAWVVMSLMDFYKNANQSERYKNIVFELSEKILNKQKADENNILSYGQWQDVYSTSGVGWICEVMAETYHFCQKERGEDCEKYKEAVVRGIMWNIQRSYSAENSFMLPNPGKALGGVFWSNKERYVRTDAVCHSLNSYILIFNDLEDKTLVSFPEKPLEGIFSAP